MLNFMVGSIEDYAGETVFNKITNEVLSISTKKARTNSVCGDRWEPNLCWIEFKKNSLKKNVEM